MSPLRKDASLQPRQSAKCHNLDEANAKITILLGEIARLESVNMKLTKENEAVRFKKTEREASLEDRISLLLAQNEKLNQVIEKIDPTTPGHQTLRQDSPSSPDMEEQRRKYGVLEAEFKMLNQRFKELKDEREEIASQLVLEMKGNEMLKNKLTDALQTILILTQKNKKRKEEISNLKGILEGGDFGTNIANQHEETQ
jgi:hypothetical protein